MQTAVIVILLLVCVALAGWLTVLRRGLRRAEQELRERMADKTMARLDLPCPDAAAEGLFRTLNELLELRQEERAVYRRKEEDLRRQIADASHDLRTPLTSILGYLQLLEEEELEPERRAEYLEIVRSRAAALQTLIASFYDLSRIEGGQWKLERERLDLGREVRDQLAAAYEQLEAAGMPPEVDIPEGLPPVWGDRKATARVISNLLTNALKHGTAPLRLELRQAGRAVALRLTNAAPDMTEEEAGRVFQRFYTADRARNGQNTGLGLAIVNALTQQMGGSCSAHLEQGLFTLRVNWPAAF